MTSYAIRLGVKKHLLRYVACLVMVRLSHSVILGFSVESGACPLRALNSRFNVYRQLRPELHQGDTVLYLPGKVINLSLKSFFLPSAIIWLLL